MQSGAIAVTDLSRVLDDTRETPEEPWKRGPYHDARHAAIASFEHSYLSELIEHTGGNIAHAARLAGMNRATIYRMIDRHRRHRRARR